MQPRVDELAKIATDAGVMEVAVDDLLFRVTEFDDSTGQIIHKATGLTVKAWIDAQREKRPHWFAAQTDENAELEQKAFGEGNVTARGKLVKGNQAPALARAKAWGLRDLNDYSRGTRPSDTPAGEKKPAAKDRNNPWLPECWNITKQGQLIKVMGLDGAARMAKAAGSFVGATKPPKAA
jgi:hypothetical protein